MKIHCKQRKLCCCEFSPFLWLCGRGSGSSDEGEGSGIGSKTRKRMQMRPERSFEGGSMQLMAYSLKAMEITRERGYELMELLELMACNVNYGAWKIIKAKKRQKIC